MRVSIDRSGRVVIPKALRIALGLDPDCELDVVVDGTGLRLEPVQSHPRQVDEGEDGFPVLVPVEGAVLTDDDVRSLRDEMRR